MNLFIYQQETDISNISKSHRVHSFMESKERNYKFEFDRRRPKKKLQQIDPKTMANSLLGSQQLQFSYIKNKSDQKIVMAISLLTLGVKFGHKH